MLIYDVHAQLFGCRTTLDFVLDFHGLEVRHACLHTIAATPAKKTHRLADLEKLTASSILHLDSLSREVRICVLIIRPLTQRWDVPTDYLH